MSLDKYIWKCRLLVIYTPNYKNKVYLKTKKVYQKKIKDFHKRSIKLITKRGANIGNITSFDVYASDHIDELKPQTLPEDLLIHRAQSIESEDTGIERVNKDITKSKYFKNCY